jgi:3-hydroxybutyryl-CoA dehydrogenase
MRKIEDIKNILIIGCGTLGLRIGLRFAMDGFNVRMYDVSDASLARATAWQRSIIQKLVKKGLYTEGSSEDVMSRIETTTDPKAAVVDIDLVSESVFEDIGVKTQLYRDFAPLFEEKTIVTTNTSYLLPSMFAEETGCSDRFCAFHFHDVFTMNVVDIMPHPTTADWVVDLLMSLGKRINQTPVLIQKENQGYIFNQMLMAIVGSAMDLRIRDVASIQDIDRSWMGNFKTNLGPFGILDQIGLDTAWKVSKNAKDAKSQRSLAFLQTYIDEGKLGFKSGEGFYKYPNPEYLSKDFLNKELE